VSSQKVMQRFSLFISGKMSLSVSVTSLNLSVSLLLYFFVYFLSVFTSLTQTPRTNSLKIPSSGLRSAVEWQLCRTHI